MDEMLWQIAVCGGNGVFGYFFFINKESNIIELLGIILLAVNGVIGLNQLCKRIFEITPIFKLFFLFLWTIGIAVVIIMSILIKSDAHKYWIISRIFTHLLLLTSLRNIFIPKVTIGTTQTIVIGNLFLLIAIILCLWAGSEYNLSMHIYWEQGAFYLSLVAIAGALLTCWGCTISKKFSFPSLCLFLQVICGLPILAFSIYLIGFSGENSLFIIDFIILSATLTLSSIWFLIFGSSSKINPSRINQESKNDNSQENNNSPASAQAAFRTPSRPSTVAYRENSLRVVATAAATATEIPVVRPGPSVARQNSRNHPAGNFMGPNSNSNSNFSSSTRTADEDDFDEQSYLNFDDVDPAKLN